MVDFAGLEALLAVPGEDFLAGAYGYVQAQAITADQVLIVDFGCLIGFATRMRGFAVGVPITLAGRAGRWKRRGGELRSGWIGDRWFER